MEKNFKWHTTYGEIEVHEPIFKVEGQQYRPFSYSAEISNRGCSVVLQRIVVDFGADQAFGRVPYKLDEHYGIDLPISTIRNITEHHGQSMYEKNLNDLNIPDMKGCDIQIGEMDGSMIPIVTSDEDADDKRKQKTLCWKEARLTMAHDLGSTTPKFGVVFQGDVDDAGQALLNSAILAGFGRQTHLHSVGDGAVWIANQVSDKFGLQGSYLIDFYHVCEYLAAAAKSCAIGYEEFWLEKQKKNLKNNDYQLVINNLFPYLEKNEVDDEKAPVRACYRYLNNRTDQLDYKTAIDKGLPIGSGEIESAHRYVIQERLKLPGAWWKADNADFMLALRVIRANDQWNKYWDELSGAA